MSILNAGCLVCSKIFKKDNKENVCVAPCGHIYHEACLTRWPIEQRTEASRCVDCRAYIPWKSLKDVYLHFIQGEESEKNSDLPAIDLDKDLEIKSLSTELLLLKSQVKKFCANVEKINSIFVPAITALNENDEPINMEFVWKTQLLTIEMNALQNSINM